MHESLKQKTISGMIWNAVERFGSSLFLFLSNLVLARLLSPDDFGCIGMLLVFISISDAIVDGGFGSALIQKKNPTQADYSTVFYWNIALSVCLYGVLYLSSPLIAGFYKIPLLSEVLKVQGIVLIINAFVLIQQNILKKQVAFKKLAKINLSAIIIGTCTGMTFAFLGFGVWSLVVKSLVTGIIQCIIYWVSSHWRPKWVFSRKSFTSLFQFGGFVFFTTIVNTVYANIISLVIGKSFSATTLGYYTQARKLEDVPCQSLSAVVQNVTFPIFSQMQNDLDKLRESTRRCLKSVAFINFPLMMLMLIIAEPLFTLLFTDKWKPAVPYFQILCIFGYVMSILELNGNVMQSLGKGKLFLFTRTLQRTIGILLVFIGLNWGIKGLLFGYVLSQYVAFVIVTMVSGKLIKYGTLQQIKDLFPMFAISIITAVITYSLSLFLTEVHFLLLLAFRITIYILIYLISAKIFNLDVLKLFNQIIKNKIYEKRAAV